jgi:PAS domain S-box-containing protein
MVEIRDRKDFSARRQAEEALRKREAQLQTIIDALPGLVAYVGVDGRYELVSAGYERWFGRPLAEIRGRHIAEVVGPAAYELVRPYVERAFAGEQVTYEAEMPYANGVRFVEATLIPQRDPGGQVAGVVTLVTDITERKSFEHYRAEARSRAEQLYRFAHAAASADRLEDVFEVGLDAIERMLGADRAAVLLCDDGGVMRFRAWRKLSDEYRRAVEGHSPWPRDAIAPQPVLVPDVEADASLADYLPLFRSERIGSLAFIPLVTRGRLLGKFMVYFGERHEYSTTELELAAAIANHLASVAARFAALAELERTVHYSELFAGVLAHDLRNPLGAIVTAAQLVLMRQEGEGDRNAKPMSRIVASGQRMARMIDQLLDFTRARVGGGIEIQPRDTNLADLCSQALGELELVYTDRKFECSVVGDQGGTWDPDRLLQIISNLVANASQHGAPDGVVAVRLDGSQPDEVVLEIHNGGTISPALLPTLFDPFRGTGHRREHARGLGLGLFIVKELVRAHGGTVDVTSSEPDGTTFQVRLPRRAAR